LRTIRVKRVGNIIQLMSSFKEKLQVFMLGLMAGLIIAGGFFILKLDDYFKELNFYKNVVKTFTFKSAAKPEEAAAKPEEIAPVKEKKQKEVSSKGNATEDSITTKFPKTDFVLDADTMTKYAAKDSMPLNAANQEDIVIRKDELILTKTLEIVNLSGAPNQSNAKDSLLQKVSGIKDDKVTVPQLINAELWQSPLNYKGYKMSKYKMILYGIPSVEGLKIVAINDNIYVKFGTTVYHLENTNEFKPYERVTDESIVSKLK
jgi:hypothetical protein